MALTPTRGYSQAAATIARCAGVEFVQSFGEPGRRVGDDERERRGQFVVVFAGVVDVHDLGRFGKDLGGQVPDPDGSVAQDDDLADVVRGRSLPGRSSVSATVIGTPLPSPCRDDPIGELHVECDQESVHVGDHETPRSSVYRHADLGHSPSTRIGAPTQTLTDRLRPLTSSNFPVNDLGL